MPIFKCETCGAVDNTACTNYWRRDKPYLGGKEGTPAQCSECDPKIGKWHGLFPKQNATKEGYLLGNDGFLYGPEEVKSGRLKWREEHQDFRILGPA